MDTLNMTTFNPDMNRDGRLNVLDFNTFLAKIAAGDVASVDVNGDGTFTINDMIAFEADFASHVSPIINPEPGWTDLTLQPGGREYFWDHANGNDAHDGLTPGTAKKTISATGPLLRSGFPDQIVVMSGGDASANLSIYGDLAGPAPTNPIIFKGYQGARWSINTIAGAFRNMLIADASITGDGIKTGVFLTNSYTGGTTDLRLENCYVERCATNVVIEDAENNNNRLARITLFRCILVDSWTPAGSGLDSHDLFASNVNGLDLIECVFDRGGLGNPAGGPPGGLEIQSHDTYCYAAARNVRFINCIAARACSTGISPRGGGLVDTCLSLGEPIGICEGHAQDPDFTANGTIRNCAVVGARNLPSGDPRGTAYALSRTGTVDLFNSIAVHNDPAAGGGTGNSFGVLLEYQNHSLTIHNFIVYKWGPLSGPNIATPIRAAQQGQTIILGYGTVWQNPAVPDPSWPDPERDITTYMASLGLSGGLPEFMARARGNKRGSWDVRFTASAVIAYLFAGLNMQIVMPP